MFEPLSECAGTACVACGRPQFRSGCSGLTARPQHRDFFVREFGGLLIAGFFEGLGASLRFCPRDCHGKTVRDRELGFRQSGSHAAVDHVQSPGSGPFDVLGEIERLRDEPVARYGAVRKTQLRECQLRWQATGIPDLQPVREEHHLHAAIAGVVAVRYRVDDGLRDDFNWNLVGNRNLDAACSRAD